MSPVTDTWSTWKTTSSLDTPPSTATPEIDAELRNIKAQVKANVVPGRWAADDAGLTSLISTIATSQAEIVIDSSITIDPTGSTYNIPSNISVRVVKPGLFDVADAKTLQIDGPLAADRNQIFSWNTSGVIDLAASPTPLIAPEWFGGVTDPVAGPYANDNGPALSKAIEAIGGNQDKTISLARGLYRIATPVVYAASSAMPSIRIEGVTYFSSLIYIDVGSSDVGITLGSDTYNTFYLSLKNLSFVGPSSCCISALKMYRTHLADFDHVNAWLGCTGYAFDLEGCLWIKGDIRIRHYTEGFANWGEPASGIHISASSAPYQSNVIDLKAMISNVTDTGIFLDGTNYRNSVARISASIEGSYVTPFKVLEQQHLDLSDLYIEGAGTSASLTNCQQVGFNNSFFNDASVVLYLDNVHGATLTKNFLPETIVQANCANVEFGEGNAMFAGKRIYNFASDTKFPSGISGIVTQDFAKDNLLSNALLTRWSATAPDGWNITDATVTQEASIIHNATYSIKIVTTGTGGSISYPVPASIFQRLLGRKAIFSGFALIPSGTYTPGIAPLVPVIEFTGLPTWSHTAFTVGEGVVDSNGYIWICKVGGTTDAGGAPAWPTPVATKSNVVDGSVVWGYPDTSYVGSKYYDTDVGLWIPIGVGKTVPTNATGVNLVLYAYDPVTGHTTAYFSEPNLVIGQTATIGPVAGRNEFTDYIQVGANRLYFGQTLIPSDGSSPLLGLTAKTGDVAFNSGAITTGNPLFWFCKTPGINGSTSVWVYTATIP